MSQEKIERAMEDAGWRVDSGFAAHLIVGYDGHLSILAPRWVWELDEPVFELYDEQKDVTYWAHQIPTSGQAGELLEEHGGPPEEHRGNPYCNAAGNGEREEDQRET